MWLVYISADQDTESQGASGGKPQMQVQSYLEVGLLKGSDRAWLFSLRWTDAMKWS